MKHLLSRITAVMVSLACLLSMFSTVHAEEDLRFSPEYMSSPFYAKLVAALEDTKDKTAMERTLAVALSQEGYKNYATTGIDIGQARADGLLWTGAELRMNAADTGNTEYTRWAQRYVMNRGEEAWYLDCDWCAIFVSWALYQAGYYDEEKLKKYYYSYYAEPRVAFDADSWIMAFNLEQKNVWYAPKAHHKLDAYDWSTYYHVDIDPYDMPYKPGGIVFFSWDGSGEYFDHVAIVVDYDPDTHVLTYSNGNSGGQVITRQIDLDVEEEFRGMAFTKNSNRIMAYGEYDAVKPLEPKHITASVNELLWDKNASPSVRFQTNSDSKVFSVTVDDAYLGSNIESNMLLQEGRVAIGKSELVSLAPGQHALRLIFDDGVLDFMLYVTDSDSLPEKHFGDVNLDGVVNIEDATLIQKVSVELLRCSDLHFDLADVNGDGRVSVLDVTCVQKYIAQYAEGMGKTGEIAA